MGGPRVVRPEAPAVRPPAAPAKKRVLFVCIGNSCRSQMAEAFARAYGSDVIEARSAGLSPAMIIAPLTREVLGEKNIQIHHQFPKGLDAIAQELFDVVINMSGTKLQISGAQQIEWAVEDPIGQPAELYRSVAAQIESLVMRLILELRKQEPEKRSQEPEARSQNSGS